MSALAFAITAVLAVVVGPALLVGLCTAMSGAGWPTRRRRGERRSDHHLAIALVAALVAVVAVVLLGEPVR